MKDRAEDIQSLAKRLVRRGRQRGFLEFPEDGQLLFLAMAALLEAAGECRQMRPHALLRPVLDDDGLRWACTHPEAEHRSELVAPAE
jgi:hypothetical protein